MMKAIAVSILSLVTTFSCAEESSKPEKADVSKISEAFGHLIGKNLDASGVKLDIAKVIQGLENAAAGKEAPMTEMEYIDAMTSIQETAFKETAVENLKKADAFLADNSHADNVHVIVPGKLQYKIEQEGTGEGIDETCAPLIRYSVKLLDGAVFDSSKENEMVRLDETIPGFSKGLIGMKEGERRTLYIHPELGYGTMGDIPPNSLLTFEVEVVKRDAPHVEPIDSLTTPKPHGNPEIAAPFEELKAVR